MAARQSATAALRTVDGLSRDLLLSVLVHGPIARRDLADRLGVSAPTLTRLAAPLLRAGLVLEAEDARSGALGRPARPLDIAAGSHSFVGVKLSADRVHAVRTDLRARVLRSSDLAFTSPDPTDVVEAIAHVIDEVAGPEEVAAIGVSFGGSTRDNHTVARAPFLGWTDVPLGELVSRRLGRPVALENDLTALTVAELWFGDGRDIESFAVVTIGAAVGYGLVTHRRLVTSPDAGIGLVGHFPLDPEGPWCGDGHRGCADSLLSMKAVEAVVTREVGRPVSFDQALDLASGGDPVAGRVVRTSGAGLGRLVAAIVNLTMVQRVFVSGEGVRLAQLALPSIREAIARDRDPNADPVDLVVQDYDSDLWARGAAAVAIQRQLLGEF